MGLDLVLGGMVLVAAVRGWFKGFVVQAIRLGGLVAAVYAAGPVRDQIKPYALKYHPTIRPDLVDDMTLEQVGALAGCSRQAVHKLAISFRRTMGLPS